MNFKAFCIRISSVFKTSLPQLDYLELRNKIHCLASRSYTNICISACLKSFASSQGELILLYPNYHKLQLGLKKP